tara:strand:+ start:185 stop:358 length:174 start_codon:yes stop_codon:yes gene_type:complete
VKKTEINVDYDEMLKAEVRLGLEQLVNMGLVEVIEHDGKEKYRTTQEKPPKGWEELL